MIVPRRHLSLGMFLLAASVAACGPADRTETAEGAAESPDAADGSPAGVVEVSARDFAFEAPARIPSGWTTFRMTNAGQQEHFLVLWRLPEGKTFEDYREEVIGPFETSMKEYAAGEVDRAGLMEALGSRLPEWLPPLSALGMGGAGLTSPGRVTRTAVKLEPGEYVMECYVKTPDGMPHSFLGMLRPLTVTSDSTGAAPPEADVEMTLSNYRIETAGELTPGEHTVRVRVAENPEGLLGHDVHLARLDEGTDVAEVVKWMDWVDALEAPAPAEFVGGAEQVPVGHTTYFTVELAPGRYAWVSEGYAERGMVQEFTIE